MDAKACPRGTKKATATIILMMLVIVSMLSGCLTYEEPEEPVEPVEPTYDACSCDLNNDKVVNYADLSVFMSNYGKTGEPGWIRADINKDGVVDTLDLDILDDFYGQVCEDLT